LKYTARVARDILAVPGVSISVERLFSGVMHTIGCSVVHDHGDSVRGYCYQGVAEVGLAQGVNYMDFIKIHDK
jgi:hypothetical protein